jgi:hypothetical protein
LDKTPKQLLTDWHATGPTLAFGDLYHQWEKWFRKEGWSAFDNDQTALFDELRAEYNKAAVIDGSKDGSFQPTTFDVKPTFQAKLDKASSDRGDKSCHVLDKDGGRAFDLRPRPSPEYPHDEILTVYDGVNKSQSPELCAAILNSWRLKYPEQDYPDSIISKPWAPPRDSKPTRHSGDVDELNPLLAYRDYQAFEESIKTNFYLGDNDNHHYRKEGEAPSTIRDVERELETRPSVEEIKSILATSPTNLDDVFRFNMTDYDSNNKFSKYRGEMTGYMSGGKMRPVVDRFGTPFGPKQVVIRNASSGDVRKLSHSERSQLEQKAQNRWERLGNFDLLPVLPPTTVPLNEARFFCGLSPKPANENIYSGIPWIVPNSDRKVPNKKTGQTSSAQTFVGLSAGNPEDILQRKQEKTDFGTAVSGLSPNDIRVLDSAVYAANFTQVGRECGDENKSAKTQERNGQSKVRQAVANLDKIAA